MKNETYDKLKWLALTLPLVITFITAIMKIWNIPYAIEIGLSLNAFNALVAGIVKIANENYNKEQGQIKQDEMEEEEFEEDDTDEEELQQEYFEDQEEMEDEL